MVSIRQQLAETLSDALYDVECGNAGYLGREECHVLAFAGADALLDSSALAVTETSKPSVNGEDDLQWTTASHTVTQSFSGEVVIDDRLAVDGSELAEMAAVLAAAARRYAQGSGG